MNSTELGYVISKDENKNSLKVDNLYVIKKLIKDSNGKDSNGKAYEPFFDESLGLFIPFPYNEQILYYLIENDLLFQVVNHFVSKQGSEND